MQSTTTAATTPPRRCSGWAILGSVIMTGLFGIVIAPFISRLLRFFPSVVTG